MYCIYPFSQPWMKYCSSLFFWHLCYVFGKHFRNHFKRIHVHCTGSVWQGVKGKPASGNPLTEGAQKAKRTSIIARLQPLAVWLLGLKSRVSTLSIFPCFVYGMVMDFEVMQTSWLLRTFTLLLQTPRHLTTPWASFRPTLGLLPCLTVGTFKRRLFLV